MKKELLTSVILMILCIVSVFSQNQDAELDSLWQVGKQKSFSVDKRLEALASLGLSGAINVDKDSFLVVLKELQSNPNASDHYYQVYIYKIIGDLLLDQSKNIEALSALQKGEIIMNEKYGVDDKHLLVKGGFLNTMARAYSVMGNEEQGIRYMLKGIEVQKLNNHTVGVVYGYGNLGAIYGENKDYEEAAKYIKKALIYADSLGDKGYKIFWMNELAAVYQLQGNLLISDSLLNVAEKYSELNDGVLKNDIQFGRGSVQYGMGNYEEALDMFISLEQAYKDNDDVYNLNRLYHDIGSTYQSLNQYNKSIEYCLKSYNAYKEYPLEQFAAVNCLTESYQKIGNYKAALKYSQIAATLQDSLFNQEKTKEMTQLVMQQEFKEEKAETEAEYQLTLQRQRAIQSGMAGGLGLLGLVLFFAYRAYRIKKKANNKISRQNVQLEQLNQTKDRIFSIIGHDLKKPAIAFRGITEKLKYLIEGGDKERLLKFGESVETDAIELNRLTDNLLNWAMLQKDLVSIDSEELDLHALVEQNIALFQRIANEKNISLAANISIDAVKSDKHILSTVIRNLLDNAIKYTPEGGAINIDAKEVEGKIALSVQDTGVGMSEDQITKLFELQKTKSTRGTNGEGGTGLGMHLVQQLVERIDGTIEVASQLGKGSTINVSLPYA